MGCSQVNFVEIDGVGMQDLTLAGSGHRYRTAMKLVRIQWWTRRVVVFFASFFLITVG